MEKLYSDILVDIITPQTNKDIIKEKQNILNQVNLLCKRLKYINNFELSCFGDTVELNNIHMDKEIKQDDNYNANVDFIGYGIDKNGSKIYFKESDIVKIRKILK